jgi:hypothetical protein
VPAAIVLDVITAEIGGEAWIEVNPSSLDRDRSAVILVVGPQPPALSSGILQCVA